MRPRLAVYALVTILLAVAPNSWAQQRSSALGPDDVTKELAGKAWVVKLPGWLARDGVVQHRRDGQDHGRPDG